MTAVWKFIQFNLLPSLLAGLIVWGLILISLRLLRIGYGRLRLSLLYAPVIKSLLVLLGISAVAPWPRMFSDLHAKAFGPQHTLPWLLIWLGGFLILRRVYLQHIEQQILSTSRPAPDTGLRLPASLKRAQEELQVCPVEVTGDVACCIRKDLPEPRLLVHEGIRSPLVVDREDRPAIVFPKELVPQLSDEELDHAVAHELAHLMLGNPAWCSPEAVRHVAGVAPIAHLLTFTLESEEEKACDDMAVAAIGRPDVFADMLLKSYRFAREGRNPWQAALRSLPKLLGARIGVSERVERQLDDQAPSKNLRLQALATCLLWTGLFVLVF